MLKVGDSDSKGGNTTVQIPHGQRGRGWGRERKNMQPSSFHHKGGRVALQLHYHGYSAAVLPVTAVAGVLIIANLVVVASTALEMMMVAAEESTAVCAADSLTSVSMQEARSCTQVLNALISVSLKWQRRRSGHSSIKGRGSSNLGCTGLFGEFRVSVSSNSRAWALIMLNSVAMEMICQQ